MNRLQANSSGKFFERSTNVPAWPWLVGTNQLASESLIPKIKGPPNHRIHEYSLPQELVGMVNQIAPKINSINDLLVSFLCENPADIFVDLTWTHWSQVDETFKSLVYAWMYRRLKNKETIKSISAEFIHLMHEAGYENIFRRFIIKNEIVY